MDLPTNPRGKLEHFHFENALTANSESVGRAHEE
jgi:hypothetical protein